MKKPVLIAAMVAVLVMPGTAMARGSPTTYWCALARLQARVEHRVQWRTFECTQSLVLYRAAAIRR